jgi:hypothetical protein
MKGREHMVAAGRPTAGAGREFGLSPGSVRIAKYRVLSKLRGELGSMLD